MGFMSSPIISKFGGFQGSPYGQEKTMAQAVVCRCAEFFFIGLQIAQSKIQGVVHPTRKPLPSCNADIHSVRHHLGRV